MEDPLMQDHLKKNEDAIIKMQALARGNIARNQYREQKLLEQIDEEEQQESTQSTYMVYFSSEERMETNYLQFKSGGNREYRDAYKFSNGSVYEGEWLGKKRDG